MNVRNLKGSKLLGGVKKKDRFRTVFFLSNLKDWYVISRERVCNRRRRMASRASVYLPYGLIPYRPTV